MEEAPESYKDVTDVVNTCHAAGISQKCIKLRPIGVIKGWKKKRIWWWLLETCDLFVWKPLIFSIPYSWIYNILCMISDSYIPNWIIN